MKFLVWATVLCSTCASILIPNDFYLFRGGSIPSPAMAGRVEVSLFGFNKDNHEMRQSVFSDAGTSDIMSLVQWNSTRDALPSSMVVGHVSRYSLRDIDQKVLPFVQSYIDEVVRMNTQSKLLLLIESSKNSHALNELMQHCTSMIGNAILDDGTEAVNIIDIEVILLPTNQSKEKLAAALKRARDAVNAAIRTIKESSTSNKSAPARRSANRPATVSSVVRSMSSVESAAIEECSKLENELVNDFSSKVNTVVEKHTGNTTETIQSLHTVLREAVTAHSNAKNRLLVRFQGSKALQTAEVRARLNVIAVLSPLFTSLAEDLCVQAEDQFNFNLATIKLNQGYPQRVQALRGQIVGNLTSDLNYLQAEGSLLSTITCGGTTGRNNRGGLLRWFGRRSHNVGKRGPPLLDTIIATSLTSFSPLPCLRPFSTRLSARCKELLSTALYRGAVNPYLREYTRGKELSSWLPPLRLGLHYCSTPALWSGALYDRGHYETPSSRQRGVYANRAEPLRFPGVATVPFDPREAPESAEEPLARRTDWWMDALPQWAKYRVLRAKPEFQ